MTSTATTCAATPGHEPLRIGVVGCGVIGRLHAKVAADLSDLQVAAVIDPRGERTAALAERLTDAGPAPARFEHLEQALAAAEFDVVAICTPSGTHAQLAATALRAGKHVIIEKPVDVSVAAGLALRDVADQHPGQVVAVISQHRHDFSSLAVDRALQAGRFGRITSAVASVDWYRTQAYYDSGQWRGTWEFDGGGALMNQGVHTLDLLLWFLGEPVTVFAQSACLGHDRIEVEDVLVATVSFASGALATVHASTAVYPDLGVRLQVHGTDGSAVIEGDALTFFHARDAEGEEWKGNQAEAEVNGTAATGVAEAGAIRGTLDPSGSHVSQYGNSHITQYVDVVEAIRSGREPWVTLDDGLLALATARAFYVSATLGQPVQVSDVLDGLHDGVTTRTGPLVAAQAGR